MEKTFRAPQPTERARRNAHRPRALLVATPFLLIGATLALRFVAGAVYEPLVAEDGVYEWGTGAAYFVGAVLALSVAARLRRHDALVALAYACLGAAFVFIAGEEVTWGQRILGFEGSEALVALNRQDEANLHNLLHNRVLHAAYIAIGLYGGFLGRWLLPRFVGATRARLLAPEPALAAWFLAPTALFLYVVYFDWVNPTLGTHVGPWAELSLLDIGRLQEVAELVLVVGFLLFFLRVRRAPPVGTQRA